MAPLKRISTSWPRRSRGTIAKECPSRIATKRAKETMVGIADDEGSGGGGRGGEACGHRIGAGHGTKAGITNGTTCRKALLSY